MFIVVVVSLFIFYGSDIDTTIIFSQSPSIYQPSYKLKGLDQPFTSFYSGIIVLKRSKNFKKLIKSKSSRIDRLFNYIYPILSQKSLSYPSIKETAVLISWELKGIENFHRLIVYFVKI